MRKLSSTSVNLLKPVIGPAMKKDELRPALHFLWALGGGSSPPRKQKPESFALLKALTKIAPSQQRAALDALISFAAGILDEKKIRKGLLKLTRAARADSSVWKGIEK